MELHDFLKALRTYIWFIVLLTVLAAVSAWVVSAFMMVPHYRSTTMVVIRKGYYSSNFDMHDALFDSGSITLFTKIAESDTVASKVIGELNLNINSERFKKLIDISADYQTGVLDVSVETSQAELSMKIIEAYIRALQAEAESLFPNVTVHTIDAPKYPEKPSGPIIPLNVGLSALGGILAGMLLAVLFSVREQTKSDLSVLEKFPGLFVLGFMPRIIGKNKPFIFLSGDTAGEAVRMTGANLQYHTERENIKTVLISSPHPAEGKTTVAVNLAATMVGLGRRILIIDCSGGKPSFFTNGSAGAADGVYTVGNVSDTGFDIAAAPRDENGIAYAKMRQFLETFENGYDLIFLDCPPVMTSADTLLLSRFVQHMVLVVDYRALAFNVLHACIRRLNSINVAVLGVIVNRMPQKKLVVRTPKHAYRSRR